MKTHVLTVLLMGSFILSSSASSPKPVHQRSWLGGEYKLAKNPTLFPPPDAVGAFPESLRKQQRAGILVTALQSNTPAAMGGLQAGDLVLKVNDRRVENLAIFFKLISAGHPGHVLQLSVYRDGEVIECPVTLGRETYQKGGTITFGLLLSGDWDLLPNPNFSLIALGYKKRVQRLELNALETRYRLHAASGASTGGGITSSEGWQMWCLIFGVSSHKQILSQETIPNHSAETAFAIVTIR